MFARGEEIPLFIQGEADGSFDIGDFVEFYGKGNDGFADAELYGSQSNQANPYYSLFYFIEGFLGFRNRVFHQIPLKT